MPEAGGRRCQIQGTLRGLAPVCRMTARESRSRHEARPSGAPSIGVSRSCRKSRGARRGPSMHRWKRNQPRTHWSARINPRYQNHRHAHARILHRRGKAKANRCACPLACQPESTKRNPLSRQFVPSPGGTKARGPVWLSGPRIWTAQKTPGAHWIHGTACV